MKHKILSLILVFAMTVSLLTVGTGAVEPTYGDTAGHWAESSIERWSGHGIIQGSSGQFDPNGQLTCAQLATILAKLLKLPAAKDAGFTDNTADAWYYDAINRCAAAGILNGNGDGTVTPEAPITRERAMVMLARALGIEPIRKPDLTKYTDAAQVSAYAQGYVAALIEAGIVGGVTADELAPQANINRASTVTILDRAISTYADKAGATVKADGKGLVLVVAENVKITGAPEGTKIVVADGATGLTVNGKSVSDDQTYIVPKTEPAKPSGGSSSGGSYTPPHSHSYNETTHKCSCGEVDPAYAVASVSGKNYLTLSEAITAAQAGNKTMTLAADKTTTVSIQEILDGQHGSIDGLTIELPSGDYSALEFGRATKYPGSNTKYHTFKGGYDARTETTEYTTAEELKTTLADTNTYHGNLMYIRSLNNITLKAATGANVNIAGVSMESAHVYGTGDKTVHDYVLNNDIVDTNKSFWLVHHVNDIKFEGLNFTGNVNIASSLADALIDGVTFDNCSFTTNGTESDKGQALRYYNENNNGKVSDLKVINCTFTNCRQGVYTGHIKNVTVTGSSFTNTGHNAIAIQDHRGACNHGVVQITGNTFTDIHNRIIRFNSVGADTSITITYNTATNSGDESDEVIKITSLAQGATCDIHDNSWGDGKKVNIPDSRVEMQAQIGEAQYATLAAALAAAKSGDTVKLVGDTTLTSSVEINKSITLDLNGKAIHYTGETQVSATQTHRALNVTGGNVTIKNGLITTTVAGTDYPTEFDAVVVKSGADVTLKDMNITINDAKGSCLYVFEGGKATVKSGSYTNTNTSGEKLLLNQKDNKPQAIFVEGGTFNGRNPESGDNSGNPSTFLAEGYEAVGNEGKWTVKPIFAGGTGTAEDPFVIQNAEQFKAFRDNVNAGNTFAGKTIELTGDIDLNSVENWVPIGNESGKAFAGTFDGNNKTISNLKITSGGYIGLFGYVDGGAAIKNVNLVGANVSGTERVGGLIGEIIGNTTVSNCSIDETSHISGTDSNTGGLIGAAINGTAISLSGLTNRASVTNTQPSTARAGGIIGQVTTNANVTITDCHNEGAVTATGGYAGGIVSAYQHGALTINRCANSGTLTGAYKGNLVAWITSVRSLSISVQDANVEKMIGLLDKDYKRNITINGTAYFLNEKDDPFTFESALGDKELLDTVKIDKIIDFYRFAKTKNQNFVNDNYPETYWDMFDKRPSFGGDGWPQLLAQYNSECGTNLSQDDFNFDFSSHIAYYIPAES